MPTCSGWNQSSHPEQPIYNKSGLSGCLQVHYVFHLDSGGSTLGLFPVTNIEALVNYTCNNSFLPWDVSDFSAWRFWYASISTTVHFPLIVSALTFS